METSRGLKALEQEGRGNAGSWMPGTSLQPYPKLLDTQQLSCFWESSKFFFFVTHFLLFPRWYCHYHTYFIDSKMRFLEGANGLISLFRSIDMLWCAGAYSQSPCTLEWAMVTSTASNTNRVLVCTSVRGLRDVSFQPPSNYDFQKM